MTVKELISVYLRKCCKNWYISVNLVILLYAMSYGRSQTESYIMPSSVDDLLDILKLPAPSQYSQVFEDLPAVKVTSERSLAMFRSDFYA